ncbi:MAG TPA: hypothetical protein VII73_13805 [Caulobacteraceae bacterium]
MRTSVKESAHGGAATKIKLLEIEGARIGEAPTLFGDLPMAMTPAPQRKLDQKKNGAA